MKSLILGLGLLSLISLNGCSALVYQRDIQQGNILTEKNILKLHKGMTKNQVVQLLGTPLNLNTFSQQPIRYVYFLKPRRGKTTRRRVTLTFKSNLLIKLKINQ